MTKEGFIDSILSKLGSNTPLTESEMIVVSRALHESSHCFQEPYYEVIYHDEYGNKESRIMNPISSRFSAESTPGCKIKEDRFDLVFRRIVRKEK